MSEKPPPCPFCGSEDLECSSTEDSELFVHCLGCGAGIMAGDPEGDGGDEDDNGLTATDRAQCFAAWNTRPPLPAPAGRPEPAKRVPFYETVDGQFVYEDDEEEGEAKAIDYALYSDYEALQAYAETLEAERDALKAKARAVETVNDKLRTQGCPVCSAEEVEASGPRTVYACGASDYDQRPGTLKPCGPRRQVMEFALLMEAKLKANDHKGGWENCEESYLLKRLKEEVMELEKACDQFGHSPKHRRPAVGLEAADVANFAMMLADLYNALASTPPQERT